VIAPLFEFTIASAILAQGILQGTVMADTVGAIVEFIDELKAGEGAAPVQPGSRLMELGLLDSMGLVRLIQFVEERFGISIPDADVTPDLFASPADLAAYVNGRSA